VSSAEGTFYWVTRYLGNLPLIYAVKIEGDFPERIENMAGLSVAASYALGNVSISMPESAPENDRAPGEVGNIGAPSVAPDAPPYGTPVRPYPGADDAALDE
jgi:hypothetical protein